MTLPHNYEMVIGLEVHAQITTASKLFSGAATAGTATGAEPNTQACAIDLGMPGMLPVLNSGAVEAGIKLGLGIGATIAATARTRTVTLTRQPGRGCGGCGACSACVCGVRGAWCSRWLRRWR